jgi:hypothetical protein
VSSLHYDTTKQPKAKALPDSNGHLDELDLANDAQQRSILFYFISLDEDLANDA